MQERLFQIIQWIDADVLVQKMPTSDFWVKYNFIFYYVLGLWLMEQQSIYVD